MDVVLQREEDLKNLSNRFKALISTSMDGYWEIDNSGRIIFINEATCRLYGFNNEEMLARSLWDFEAALHSGEISERINLIKQLGHTRFESRHKRKDGSVFDVEVSVTYLPEDDKFIAFQRNISERKQAERQLEERERLYHTIFDLGPDGIVVVDPVNQSIIDFNDYACNRLGYSRQEFSRLGLSDIEASESPAETGARIRKIVSEGADQFEALHRTKTGELRNVLVTVRYTEIGGRFICHSVWRDITRQKKDELLFKARCELFDYSMNHSVDEILTNAVDTIEALTGSVMGFFHFLGVDQRTLAFHAWSTRTLRDHCRADRLDSHYDVDQAGVWVDCVRRREAVVYNDIESLPFRKGVPTGHAKVQRILTAPVFRGNSIVGVLGLGNKPADYTQEDRDMVVRFADYVWDIVERKQALELLRDSNERFYSIFENAPVAMTISRLEDGCCLEANSFFLEASGRGQHEVIGSNFVDMGWISQDVRDSINGGLSRDGSVNGIEISTRSKNGEIRQFSYFGRVIRIGGYDRLLSIGVDITDQSRMAQTLVQMQKLESVGRLAGGIAHDFNNKLSVIMGYAQLGVFELPDTSNVESYYSEILQAATFSRDLTSQLLAFSRQQQNNPIPINLDHAVRNALKSLKHLIGEDIQVVFEPLQSPLVVMIDPIQLEQVVMNLCVNARDAMPGGGSITASVCRCAIGGNHTGPEGLAAGEYALLAFRDTGSGMDEHTIRHIFEPFFTTKDVGKGTGLGLATVHGIVMQNSGAIEVDSSPGQGTLFRVYLPIHQDAAGQEPVKDGHEAGRKLSVMLVEDDPLVRNITIKLLERLGHRVTAYDNPPDAIAAFAEKRADIDIILTDVLMPAINGIEMVARIREFDENVPVLFMSGYAPEYIRQRGVRTGQISIMQKPLSMDDLSRRLQEAARAGRT